MQSLRQVLAAAIRRSPKMSLRKLARALKLDYTLLYSLAGYLDPEDHRRIVEARRREQEQTAAEKAPGYGTLSPERREALELLDGLPESELPAAREYLRLLHLKVRSRPRRSR